MIDKILNRGQTPIIPTDYGDALSYMEQVSKLTKIVNDLIDLINGSNLEEFAEWKAALLNELEAWKAQTEAAIAEVKTSAEAEIAEATKNALDQLKAGIEQLQEEIKQYETAATAKIDEKIAEINTALQRLKNYDHNISDLSERMVQLETTVPPISATAEKNKDDISTLKAAQAQTEAELSRAETRIAEKVQDEKGYSIGKAASQWLTTLESVYAAHIQQQNKYGVGTTGRLQDDGEVDETNTEYTTSEYIPLLPNSRLYLSLGIVNPLLVVYKYNYDQDRYEKVESLTVTRVQGGYYVYNTETLDELEHRRDGMLYVRVSGLVGNLNYAGYTPNPDSTDPRPVLEEYAAASRVIVDVPATSVAAPDTHLVTMDELTTPGRWLLDAPSIAGAPDGMTTEAEDSVLIEVDAAATDELYNAPAIVQRIANLGKPEQSCYIRAGYKERNSWIFTDWRTT